MLSFFTPQLKIQKNRQVLRDTDERMAKYSRRGLIGNFVIFLLCMAVGSFVDQEPGLAIALTIGLLITTLLRGYLLFRFDALYPRAPGLWRTRYFYATILGAAWWGLIVALETLIVGIDNETPLLWLYTIVFFAMTANAFAPYKQFLTLYQLLGLVPGAFCLLVTGEMIGVIYAIVVFFFIWLLHHQCEQIADNYWERLESNDSLARKTESLEEEKRDTRAMAQLHKDYMLLLKSELEELLSARRKRRSDDASEENKEATQQEPEAPLRRPRLQQLHENVSDFYQILSKDITFEARVFNAASVIQYIAKQYTELAASREIDIELSVSPALPRLVLGDSDRLSQIFQSMLNAVIKQLEHGTATIELDFIQERGKQGELNLCIHHQPADQKTLFNAQQSSSVQLNLELALAIGLAEAQEGTLDFSTTTQGTQLRYRAKYPGQLPVNTQPAPLAASKGKRVLLVHENPRVLDTKRQELSLLGLNVTTENQFKKAITQIKNGISKHTPFAAVIFHAHADIKATTDFSQALLAESDCKLVPQIIMGPSHFTHDEAFREILTQPYVHWLNKPATADDFRHCFWRLFGHDSVPENETDSPLVAIIGGESASSLFTILSDHHCTCHQFEDEKSLLSATANHNFDFFIFTDQQEVPVELLGKIRQLGSSSHIIYYNSPEFALSWLADGADIALKPGIDEKLLISYLRTQGE